MHRNVILGCLVVLSLCAGAATAHEEEEGDHHVQAKLHGNHEVPAISGFGKGTFEGNIDADLTHMDWELHFSADNSVTQAHIHFAQEGVNGGIMVFLCSNLGNGPAGTPACPDHGGHLSGTIDASDVGAGATAQGVDAGSFYKFQRAVRQGVAYVNVHSTKFPGGEIRGQLALVDRDGHRLPVE